MAIREGRRKADDGYKLIEAIEPRDVQINVRVTAATAKRWKDYAARCKPKVGRSELIRAIMEHHISQNPHQKRS